MLVLKTKLPITHTIFAHIVRSDLERKSSYRLYLQKELLRLIQTRHSQLQIPPWTVSMQRWFFAYKHLIHVAASNSASVNGPLKRIKTSRERH